MKCKIKIIKMFGDFAENAFDAKYLVYKIETDKDWKDLLEVINEQFKYAEKGEKMKLVLGEISEEKFKKIPEVY